MTRFIPYVFPFYDSLSIALYKGPLVRGFYKGGPGRGPYIRGYIFGDPQAAGEFVAVNKRDMTEGAEGDIQRSTAKT